MAEDEPTAMIVQVSQRIQLHVHIEHWYSGEILHFRNEKLPELNSLALSLRSHDWMHLRHGEFINLGIASGRVSKDPNKLGFIARILADTRLRVIKQGLIPISL
jgi:hypothetical protein